jgi:glycine betaine/proline transport system ATP-binding protein
MKSPVATIRRQDGPRVALRAMQEHGISSIFVVERGQRLVGAVMADAALEVVEKGQKTLEGIMETDVPTVHPDTLISDILPRVATTA